MKLVIQRVSRAEVRVAGEDGQVKEVGLFASKLGTPSNELKIVPVYDEGAVVPGRVQQRDGQIQEQQEQGEQGLQLEL